MIAVILWATGVTPDALLAVGALWSIYGLIHAVLDGVLDPLIDTGASWLQNIGLTPFRASYTRMETLVARGEHRLAAAEYEQLANAGDAAALVRRAALLAGPLGVPVKARIELEEFREARQLSRADDIRIGLALADVYEKGLSEPGPAMRELRRLLDRYPNNRGLRQFRQTLAALKREQFHLQPPPPAP